MILDHLHAYVLLIHIYLHIYQYLSLYNHLHIHSDESYQISHLLVYFFIKQFSMEKGQVIKLTHLGRIKQCKSMVSLRISGTNQRTKFGLVSYQ